MKTKYLSALILIIFFTVLSFNTSAQIAILNKSKMPVYLNGTKSLLVNLDERVESQRTLKTILQQYWTLTPIKFVSRDEFVVAKTLGSDLILELETFTKEITSTSGNRMMMYDKTYKYFTIYGLGEKRDYEFARIELYYSYLDQSVLYNFSPGFIKTYILAAQEYLKQGMERSLYKGEKNLEALSALRTDTLFIPEYTLIRFNKLNGSEDKRHEEKDLMEGYGHPYKIISMEELSKKIIESKKEIYFLSYVKSCTDKYVSVYEGKNNKLIYSEYSGMSYNINSGDLSQISKNIK